MQVTIGANCWDGARRQTIYRRSGSEEVVHVPAAVGVEGFAEKFKRGAKRLNDPKLKAILGYAVPIALLLHGFPPIGLAHALASSLSPVPGGEAVPAMAMGEAVRGKILHAFDPLIDLIQSLAYPIAGVMIAGGCLFIMVGNRERGMQMLQNAAIGYILVQLSPMLLNLLVGIGAGV